MPEFTRAYRIEEKLQPDYQAVALMCGDRRGPFRAWEYPAVWKLMEPVSQNSQGLCIGAWNDGLAKWITHHAVSPYSGGCLRCVDRIWASMDQDWGPGAYVMGDLDGLHAETIDWGFAVSSLEHPGDENRDLDIETMRRVGELLKPGARFYLTTEWGPKGGWDPEIVGGWVYNNEMLQERLIEPSGLRMLGDLADLSLPPDYGAVVAEEPRVGQAPFRFCPALIILEKIA